MLSNQLYADKIAYDLKTGYWKVNDKFFFHKADCLRYASKIKDYNVTFHYFDNVFKTIDWKVEPTQSLQQLYKERAQQLRDKYKYLVLAFSGGADSTNVLEAFINNGIKLDEVVSYYPVKQVELLQNQFNPNDRSSKNLMFEWLMAAKPKLDWLAKNHPDIKITIKDNSDEVIDNIIDCKLESLTQSGAIMNPNLANMFKMNAEVNEDSCIIHGHDKPQITVDISTNQFYVFFHDFSMIHGRRGNRSFKQIEPTVEYFYYTPDFPLLTVKQTLEMKRAVLALHNSDTRRNDLLLKRPLNPNFRKVDANHPYIVTTLYPTWNTLTYQVAKPKNVIYADHASYIWDNPNVGTKKVLDFFEGQLKEFSHDIDPYFLQYDPDGRMNKFKDFFTSFIKL
jgi:hypothetical protein